MTDEKQIATQLSQEGVLLGGEISGMLMDYFKQRNESPAVALVGTGVGIAILCDSMHDVMKEMGEEKQTTSEDMVGLINRVALATLKDLQKVNKP